MCLHRHSREFDVINKCSRLFLLMETERHAMRSQLNCEQQRVNAWFEGKQDIFKWREQRYASVRFKRSDLWNQHMEGTNTPSRRVRECWSSSNIVFVYHSFMTVESKDQNFQLSSIASVQGLQESEPI